MKQFTNRFFLCAIIAMIVFQCHTTIGLADSEADWYYNISMSVRSITGECLPSPTVPLEMVQDGLIVSAYNDCSADNKMTLVLLCNGQAVPFSTSIRSTKYAQQTFVNVPAKEESEVAIYPMLDGSVVQSQKTAYLQIVLIGLCDVFPRHAQDDIAGFSTVVSIPVTNDAVMAAHAANGQPIAEALTPSSRVSNENLFYGIKILSVNDIDRNTILFRTDAGSHSLRFAIIPDDSDVYVCCLVDNVLQQLNGYDGIWIHAAEGMSYEGEICLDLQPGKHQIYLMCVPILNSSPCFVTSEKIVVEVLP